MAGTGEEQDSAGDALAAQTLAAIRTAQRQLAPFFSASHDAEDCFLECTRQRRRRKTRDQNQATPVQSIAERTVKLHPVAAYLEK